MDGYSETVSKFLDALCVDLVKDIKYVDKNYRGVCVCGQPIVHGYKFINTRNHKECLVGKRCLEYVFDYIRN